MELQECPYCSLPGLVTTVKISAGHFEISGKCSTCGYTYDSAYTAAESADDLDSEYSLQLDSQMAD